MADHYKALRSNLESRESTSEASLEEPICFFFNLPSTSEKDALHLIQPFWLDQRVRRCANILHDSIHHAKLQNGGMIAQHAMYHKVCLSNFYQKASAKQLEGHYTDEERKLHDTEFGQVVTFIEETVTNATHEIPVFKLSDLVKLYNAQQKELGVHLETRIPSTRFKLRLLSQFQEMSAYNDKKEVILAFNSDVEEVIANAAATNYDDNGYILAKEDTILTR